MNPECESETSGGIYTQRAFSKHRPTKKLSGLAGFAILPAMIKHDRDDSLDSIPGRLKRTREAFKMNQADWCRMVGIDTQAWNNYESGRRRISLDQLLKVCRATGITTDWIYRGMMSASIPSQIQIELQKKRQP